MPFELSNNVTSFQKFINKILVENLYIFIIVYLDNILIYSQNLGQEYLNAVC